MIFCVGCLGFRYRRGLINQALTVTSHTRIQAESGYAVGSIYAISIFLSRIISVLESFSKIGINSFTSSLTRGRSERKNICPTPSMSQVGLTLYTYARDKAKFLSILCLPISKFPIVVPDNASDAAKSFCDIFKIVSKSLSLIEGKFFIKNNQESLFFSLTKSRFFIIVIKSYSHCKTLRGSVNN